MEQVVFYDGKCGLCHWWVQFTLRRDRKNAFRFSPLQIIGENLARQKFGDTIVVLTKDQRVLIKSEAALFILKELDGKWGMVSTLLSVIPSSMRNLVYEGVALVRRHFFRQPKELCPIVPEQYRGKFLKELGEAERLLLS
ncbi:MAG: DUF393 domain-containing protein [Bdellovibrionales bacterium]|nr:DUF393 domain-containing protein [Bdellovibrionales bacterium]